MAKEKKIMREKIYKKKLKRKVGQVRINPILILFFEM